MGKISFIWTIVLGLVIGVGANILTPFIRKWLGTISKSVSHRNAAKKVVFDNTVAYLIDHPYDEINIRVTVHGLWLRVWILMCAAVILAAGQNVVAMAVAIPMAIGSIIFFRSAYKYGKLLITTWNTRKRALPPDIDLD
jgi:hypothetical protein